MFHTMSITQTVVAVPANANTPLIAGNSHRKHLRIVNIGANVGTVTASAAATASNGNPIYPKTASNNGEVVYGVNMVPLNAFNAFSTSGTTFLVEEGN